jgi:hypothetical protein
MNLEKLKELRDLFRSMAEGADQRPLTSDDGRRLSRVIGELVEAIIEDMSQQQGSRRGCLQHRSEERCGERLMQTVTQRWTAQGANRVS